MNPILLFTEHELIKSLIKEFINLEPQIKDEIDKEVNLFLKKCENWLNPVNNNLSEHAK